ncbi:NHL repeat-containing protein [Kitasatospora mediocidica]|uniref:hypothetical protein n=1 Tax=Kitasatospora mediocidica TaxID=58352 RepID=UPI001E54E403|nr:hypothetical protein [Kitasatospora mediocidica]
MRARVRTGLAAAASLLLGSAATAVAAPTADARDSFTGPLHTVSTLASTVPANGDVNPYGTVVVPQSVGELHRGHVLVSNFNNGGNLQGTGTTLVQISPRGDVRQFAQIDPANLPGPCPGGVGLTTALTVLPGGWVVVGSLPTTDGMSDTAQAGCLLVLDSHGTVRETLSGNGINGPWDMTSVSNGRRSDLFVTNVLNGTVAAGGATVNEGTVLRLTLQQERDDQPPRLVSTTEIGSGFGERTDPAALVVGPTGVGLSPEGTLYVADTVGNQITAIPDALGRRDSAGTGRTVSCGGSLNGPLGLVVAPGGDILTVNAGDGNLVESTPHGDQVEVRRLDSSGNPPGAGALFGLAVRPQDRDTRPEDRAVYFVDDATNSLNLLTAP